MKVRISVVQLMNVRDCSFVGFSIRLALVASHFIMLWSMFLLPTNILCIITKCNLFDNRLHGFLTILFTFASFLID